MKHTIAILSIVFAISGCTWVELSDAGSEVEVAESSNPGCQLVGSTTAVSRADLAGIDRNQEKFQTELETLARNEAAKIGGNLVIADGSPANNQQVFKIYQCP